MKNRQIRREAVRGSVFGHYIMKQHNNWRTDGGALDDAFCNWHLVAFAAKKQSKWWQWRQSKKREYHDEERCYFGGEYLIVTWLIWEIKGWIFAGKVEFPSAAQTVSYRTQGIKGALTYKGFFAGLHVLLVLVIFAVKLWVSDECTPVCCRASRHLSA